MATASASRSVTLEWDASPDADITGYRVEYGPSSGVYTQRVEVLDGTITPINGLAEDQAYFFVVKAVNAAGLVSDPSNEVALPSLQEPPVTEERPPVTEEPPPVVEEPPPVVEEPEEPLEPAPSSYDAWSSQLPESMRAGTADPDKDGVANLAEYALGRLPGSADSQPVLDVQMSGNILSVSFSHPADRGGLQFILQESGDLAHWQAVGDVATTAKSATTINSIQRDLSTTSRVFYRLQVVSGGESVVTPPYGVLGTVISGTTEATGNVASTMFGLGVTRPVEFTGDVESVGSDLIHDAHANWQDGQFEGKNGAYLLEITSGAGIGTSYDIVATSAQDRTIRLAQPLAPYVQAGCTYQIRKHWTIASVFGPANEADLQGEDRVIVLVEGVYRQYYHIPGLGWRSLLEPEIDAAETILYPEDGITVQRRTPGNTALFLPGEVKRSVASIPISAGTTMVGNVYAGQMTLDSSRLFTGNPATGVNNGTESTADQVLLWDGLKYRFFFYKKTNGWREINGTNSGNVGATVIPAGGTVTVIRRGTNGFNWTPPVHPAGL
ncbi:MAG: fibronectin type III domain-containing protein [Chthoniobacteraceae bacterium]